MDNVLQSTPDVSDDKKNINFMEKLNDQGIVSYSDFLFLTSLLTKNPSDFRLPFNLIDNSQKDGVIDANEFSSFCTFEIHSKKYTPTQSTYSAQ